MKFILAAIIAFGITLAVVGWLAGVVWVIASYEGEDDE